MSIGKRILCGLVVALLSGASLRASRAQDLRTVPRVRPADPPTLIVAEHLDGMTLSGTTLFWKADCGSDFSGSRSSLKRLDTGGDVRSALHGGVPSVLYNPSTCLPSRIASSAVAVDDGFVYWLTGDGSIDRLPIDATTSTSPTRIIANATAHPISGFPSCCSIAVDATYVYWNEGHILYRIEKDGSIPQTLYRGSGVIRDIRVTSLGNIYLMDGSVLTQLRPEGELYTATAVDTHVSAYAYDGSRLYWATQSGNRYSIDSSRGDDLSHVQTLFAANYPVLQPGVDDMAADSVNLYWHTRVNVTGGPIYRMALRTPAPPVPITSNLIIGVPLVSNGRDLYWINYNEGIYRLPVSTTGTIPPGNVFITGIEVTQSIQTTDNRIPLIAFKRTIVRVYVQSHIDGDGPWSGVTARLSVDGGPHIHVPSLTYTTTVLPTGSERSSLDNSFTFELDPSETASGTRAIHVQLVPPPGRALTDTPDSTRSMSLTFGPSLPPMMFTFYGVRYAYSNPTLASLPFSDLQEEARFTTALFPTSDVVAEMLPGDPTATFDFRGGDGYLDGRAWGASLIDHAFPGGGQRIDVLQPEHNESSSWLGADTTTGSGNFVINEQFTIPDPGPVMAHEMGHSWLGSAHVISPEHPAYPPAYAGFPYTHASTGAQVGVDIQPSPSGTTIDLISSSPPPGPHWHDIMSYGHPAWASPYSYCLLIHAISQGNLACPAGANVAEAVRVPGTGVQIAAVPVRPAVAAAASPWQQWRRPRGGAAGVPVRPAVAAAASLSRFKVAGANPIAHNSPYLYVLGRFLANGKVAFYPFDVETMTQPVASPHKGTTYALELLDHHGRALSAFHFDPPVGSGHPVYTGPTIFSMYLPYNPATAQIVMLHGTKVMARRSVSPHTPSIHLLEPLGRTLTGRHTIRWTASDVDGEQLSYMVEYSRDGGTTWSPLNVLMTDTSLPVDFTTLPGSNQGLIRVLATDGVNTTEARSTPFRVPFGGPQITLLAPTNGAVFQQHQPVGGQGYAFSWQDGPITDIRHFAWSSDRDGMLGIGPWITRTLSPGHHRLTLTVTDNAGRRATSTVAITVLGGKQPMPGKPTATSTATFQPHATVTPPTPPTSTATAQPHAPSATSTPISTAVPQAQGPTATSTPTPTSDPTGTSTPTPSPTATSGPTATSTPTPTIAPLTISNVAAAPDPVGYGQCGNQPPTMLAVQAQVSGTPTYVTLQYRYVSANAKVSPGAYRKATMTLLKGNVYSVTVDVGKEGYGDLQGTSGVIEYQVLAGESGGTVASSPPDKAGVQYCIG